MAMSISTCSPRPARFVREWEERDGKTVSARVHDLVSEWGGSISARTTGSDR